MSWGDNGHARPTTEEYRSSKLWENMEKEKKAKEDEELKIEHEGHLYTFGETTIEVEWMGDPDKPPFERVEEKKK